MKKIKKMTVKQMRSEIIETLKNADEKVVARVYEALTGRMTEKGEKDGEIQIRLIT
tara:strand:- start:78 stop:245 length:168 start_codon:yes stop_codon:yes gene_type:complete